MNIQDMNTLYGSLLRTHPSHPTFNQIIHSALKMVVNHMLEEARESKEFTKALNAAEIEIAKDEGK